MEGTEDNTIKITREEIEHLLNQLNDFANSGFEDQKDFNEALATLANLILMKDTEAPKASEKIDQQGGMLCGNCKFYCPKGNETWIGRCRRRAPTFDGFHAVVNDDWCGEHKRDKFSIH